MKVMDCMVMGSEKEARRKADSRPGQTRNPQVENHTATHIYFTTRVKRIVSSS